MIKCDEYAQNLDDMAVRPARKEPVGEQLTAKETTLPIRRQDNRQLPKFQKAQF